MSASVAQVSDVLALSHERDMWLRRLLAAERAAYTRGHRDGWQDGYGAAERNMARLWSEHAGPIARSEPRLLRRRWSLRGEPRSRETFGRPHRDDYPGQGGDAA
jgi:hypothetical protein